MVQSLEKFIANLSTGRGLAAQVVHVEHQPSRPARHAQPDPPLDPALERALASQGVTQLYTHQVRALANIRAGRDVITATPTASGKTLVYSLPVLEGILADPQAKALFLFPLKALEQDQLMAFNSLAAMAGLAPPAAIYDGDTPQGLRRRLRENPPPVLISNPDMLHQAVCAFPRAWQEFLGNLRWIVIDEVHTYRGVFGSHMVQVLRRLLRLAQSAGSRPIFILSSATIANPAQHAQALTGRKFSPEQVVDECGAPSAGRYFALINPHGAASTTAAHLLTRAVNNELATICFTRSRLHTELIHAWVTRSNPELHKKVAGYRAGFLPEERRKIEKALSTGRLKAVVTTSALEMGIDIGGLDVCILVGYPGSHINTWQRSGRVGRAGRESLVCLVAQPDALDQYYLNHPRYFFERPLEAAILDPDNHYVVARHLVCAAAESPLENSDSQFDLELHRDAVREMLAQGELLEDAGGGRYHAARKQPQRLVDLRGAGYNHTIVDAQGKVVGTLDGVRVYKEGYPGAIYLHQIRQYEVTRLDLEQRRVEVRPVRVDYYTRPRSEKETEILEELGRRPAGNFLVHHGRLKVTETVTGYERRRLSGSDLLGVYPLDLPPLTFETHGLWVDIEDGVRGLVEKAGRHFMGSIHALEHAAIAMFPLFVLSDRGDLGGISIPLHPQTGRAAVFIYDGVPGGVGLAESGFNLIEGLLGKVEELLTTCECEEGCPACVHSPKCGSGNKPLDKQGALLVVRGMLGKEDLVTPAAPLKVAPQPKAAPASQPEEPLRYCVMDLETQKLAQEVGGWHNSHLMQVSVAVLYDGVNDQYEVYSENDAPRLIERMAEFEMVVGFNILRFDYAVLSAYTTRNLKSLPTLDLLKDVHESLGHRLSLDDLASATLGAAKSADGLQAVEWWRQGNLADLTSYCRHDVEITRDLFLSGQAQGHLLFKRKRDQVILKAPIDWSWINLRRRLTSQGG